MEEVLRRLETVRHLFIDTQSFCETNDGPDLLLHYLENTPLLFRSVAFESASVSIAEKDFENNSGTAIWQAFADGPAKAHRAQVYIGLGWAIAKQNVSFLPIAEKFDAALQHYAADGCGYYEGSFRQRRTILNQQLPDYLPASLLAAYDEGIGRSLWYTYNADVDRIKSKIETFVADRQAGLWKGLGIAIAYIGGCEDKLLKNIFISAGNYSAQLAAGAALAVKSRQRADTMSADTERCVDLWAKLS